MEKKKQPTTRTKIDESEKLRRRLQSLFDKKQTNPKTSKWSESKSVPTLNGAMNKQGVSNHNKAKAKRDNGEEQHQEKRFGKNNTDAKSQYPKEPLKPYSKEQQHKKQPRSKKAKSEQLNGVSESPAKKSPKSGGSTKTTKTSSTKVSTRVTTKPVQQQQKIKQVNSNKRKAPMAEVQTVKKKKTKLTPFQEVHILDTSDEEVENYTESSAADSDSEHSSSMQDLNVYEDNDRYFNSLKQYDYEESYSENDDSFEGSEEEENYSDFDENDYEEEEDSWEYTSSSDEMNDFHSTDADDVDYHLPEDVPEDLIIHQGTAAKRNLKSTDNVSFDSDNEEMQVVELKQQHVSVKIVEQPKAYGKTELLKLSETITEYNFQDVKKPQYFADDEVISNDTECPKLVPIVDENGFQLYSKELDQDSVESLGSDYQEVTDSDDLSFHEEDVNVKYLPDQMWSDNDDDCVDNECSDDGTSNKSPVHMEAVVIEAENMPCIEGLSDNKENDGSNSGVDVLLSEKLSKDLNVSFKGAVITASVRNELKEKTPKDALFQNIDKKSVVEKTLSQIHSDELHQPQSINEALNISASSSTSSTVTPSRSVFCNAIGSNHVLVHLRDPIYIYGTVRIILIAGSIEIYGYAPRLGEELEIFSPRGLSTVEIYPKPQTQQSTKAQIDVELKRLQSYFAKGELQKLSETYVLQEDALIILKRNEQRKQLTNNFKKYMSENLFPNMNSIQMERPHYASEFLLHCIINTQSDKALRIPAQWAALKLEPKFRLMLIGGKAVGKSTMLRYLVNQNLAKHNEILLIDLDIGQPELFVPQTISATLLKKPLLGPGFMLNLQPDQAFAIGQTNIVQCPHLYMRAAKKLLQWCNSQEEYSNVPWIINTMGYNKGFGAELIAVLCEMLQLTNVVQLQSNKGINNFDYLMEPHVVAALPRNIYSGVEFQIAAETRLASYAYRLHVINSAVMQESRYQREWDMSAKDMRYAILLARLSDVLVGSNAEWLTDCKPLCTSLDSLKIVNLLASEYTREQLLKAIDANLVYLCNQEENTDVLKCLGIGIVRAIDQYVNQIYLLPAAPHTIMSDVNCVAIGEIPLPTSMFTNQGPKVKNTAPFVYNTVAANTSKSVKQIYHRPPAFLGGKHKE